MGVSTKQNNARFDAIDRLELSKRLHRFQLHHAQRLAQALDRLPPSAATILAALPSLLHLNHPALPGYCNSQTPHGIHGFKPSAKDIRHLKQIAPAYAYSSTKAPHNRIDAVFFMGSAGSVAHTKHSDLDIWVCLPRGLHSALQAKLDELTHWAATHGVELQCFAVDPQQFTGGTDIATSPLLLDEFYRSACLVAGKFPLWWLIDSDDEAYHQQSWQIRQARFINPAKAIDFGPVHVFSDVELYAAGVRELERCLRTPHKSLMKLALLESYALGAPPLAVRYRELVCSGASAPELDGYVLLAEHLDHFFTGPANLERQRFFRRAWLIKTSRGNTHLMKNPRWWLVAKLWGFDEDAIQHLRHPQNWTLQELLDEHHRSVAAFAHALSFLNQMSANSQTQTSLTHAWRTDDQNPQIFDDVGALDDRLAASRALILARTQYNDKLLHALVPKNHRGNAHIRHTGQLWQLQENDHVVIVRPRLAQIFLWLKRNRLSLNALAIGERHSGKYRHITQALNREPYVALINAEGTTNPESVGEQLLISEHDDPLCYGEQQQCLVKHIDLLSTSVNGQNQAYYWHDLGSALTTLIETQGVHVEAIGGIRTTRIATRINRLVIEAQDKLSATATNYVFQLGAKLCTLSRLGDGNLVSAQYANAVEYFNHAPAAACYLSPIGALRNTEAGDCLLTLTQKPSLLLFDQDHLQLVYRDSKSKTVLHPPQRPKPNFVQSLTLFVALAKARGLIVPKLFERLGDDTVAPISSRALDEPLRFRLAFHRQQRGWSVQCGQDLWHHRKLDVQLLQAIRKRVLAHRQAMPDYPIYLTDLIITGADFMTNLQAKYTIEAALNAATLKKQIASLKLLGDPA